MNTRFLHTVALLALAASCAFAQAQTPTRVGRISLAQGQVGISGEQGEETSAALVNWPVTSRNQITTGRDARTEIKIGSTAVRLDADSALDVVELDDDSLRLHLHYGSATVRMRNPDVLRGFEMTTPQGTVHLQEAGRMRIDAGRRQDTTMVSVFEGAAVVDGGGSRLTLRAGKRAEIFPDDVRTGLAMRDNFDEWAMLRDERDDRSESARYVTSEMTGYEDLDQNGIWSDDREYGPLWSPRAMPIGWAPYRDGRWTFVQPWGWTWVDNASWGYAPFHYGRWLLVNQRWCWAPGRHVSRPVWEPALVGWVGGSNWNLSFNTRGTHHAAPAQGWYPLAPRDTYTPNYRLDHDKLRNLNRHAEESHQRGDGRRGQDNQRLGLTILPHDQFNQRSTVVVRGAPQAIVSPSSMLAAPAAGAPVAPQAVRERGEGRGDGRVAPDPRRFAREGEGRVIQRGAAAPVIVPVPAQAAVAPRPVQVLTLPPAPQPQPSPLARFGRRDDRPANDDGRRQRIEAPVQAPAPVMPPPQAQAAVVAQPVPAPVAVPHREERGMRVFERVMRDPDAERDRRPRGAESFQQQQQQAPVARPMPQMQAPQPQVQQQAPVQQQQAAVVRQAPQQAAAPVQAAAKEETAREGRRMKDDINDRR